MAGLTAGRALAQHGMRVLVVEARDRVGGRILTRQVQGEPIELGAQFVHGKPASLWSLIQESGVATYELKGKEFCWRDHSLRECGPDADETMQWMERLKDWHGPDCSFAEYLERASVPEASRGALIGYVEGFNAADHHVIGVASLARQQLAEDATEGDRLFCIQGGYSQLPEFLAAKFAEAGGMIVLHTFVERIEWKRGSVELQCRTGTHSKTFHAPKVIVALPLGVLQSGTVGFSPVPGEMQRAMQKIRMGHVRRMVLLFRERFWERVMNENGKQAFRELSFAHGVPGIFPAWWTQFPQPSRSLTAWAGGPAADAISGFGAAELEDHALQALGKLFRQDSLAVRGLLQSAESHDWQRDPFSFGAYSYLAVNGLSAPGRMAEPVDSTLFFAGEHTGTEGNWGTVHAAIESGTRAAGQLLLA